MKEFESEQKTGHAAHLHCVLPASLRPFSDANAMTPHLADAAQKLQRKLKPNLKQAIIDSGLKDGMTISFHHSFRGGDKVINMVMDVIAEMGIKNLTLASSSLTSIHSPIVGHIENGVVGKIYTSGIRGELGEAISAGLLKEPVHIHSHGGRVHLVQSGELNIDVAFIGVPCCDEFGNANGTQGKSRCGSLGYAKVDAQNANHVVMLTESLATYPNHPASITQDYVDAVVHVEEVGDPAKIGGGETRLTSNPRELLIARRAADVIINSGFFKQDFTIQTGSGGASLAVTRFLEDEMVRQGITAEFGLGGITSTMVALHEKGLIKNLLDVQCFDGGAVDSLSRNPNHVEISANEYANPSSKGVAVDRLDVVILSALEIDTQFNVNVITGSDGVIRGASGGHCDTAAGANLAIIVAPLVRGRIPTVVDKVLNVVTPGQSVDVLVTDHGIAVNPNRPEVKALLEKAGLPVFDIEALSERATMLTGKPAPIEFDDQIVAYVRYRDGSVIDVIKKVKE
ncbi:citrate lyase subunit alpha [Vibrio quintilis]|uniref:Citrate lyase alpha chain n=1 Tax=Vibrio quintilis TaxID=1117707 RepID=A0A1M7YRC9_9VIBR|nr:Citrate lyase alpha chain [Vibrio quintilis]